MGHLQLMIAPALAVMGIAFLFNMVLQHFSRSRHRDLAFGVMFGLAVIVGMFIPIEIGDGVIFDVRSLLIAAAVVFVSPLAGAVALGMGIICRILIGGVGVEAGALGMALSFGIAFAASRRIVAGIKNRIVADGLLGLLISASILSVVLLPLDIVWYVVTTIGPTFVASNVIGMILLGLLFRRQIAMEDRRLELEDHATRDPLTNLLNRRGLQAVARGQRFDPMIGQAMLYFDVDNFKQINDRHGHDIGDAVLEVVAGRISENLRDGAIFARQGGDEFSIYLTNVSDQDVRGIADRLCSLINGNGFAVDGKLIEASISMGGYWTRKNLDLDELVRRADAQLLLAKQAGKNRAQVAVDPKSTLVSAA